MNKQYFKKLNTEKLAELKEVKLAKAEQVKLSLVGDAEKMLSDVKKTIAQYKKAIDKTEAEADKVTQSIFELEATYDGVIDAGADLLGFQQDLNKTMKALEKSADDLGMNADDIPVYDELDAQLEEIKEAFNDQEDRLRATQDLIKAV